MVIASAIVLVVVKVFAALFAHRRVSRPDFNTIKSYLNYLENGWLFFTLARFSQSTKQQQLAPKKILTIDIDFYLPRERLLIQVCYDLSAPDTQARELKALEQALLENNDHRGIIVCFDDLSQKITDNKKIEIISGFRYLTKTLP